MKFSDAVRHYEQGKSIRLKTWPPGSKMTPDVPNGYLDFEKVVKEEWELYTEPEVKLSEIKDGELFEYADNQYRKVPSYLQEYSHCTDIYPIMAIRHKHKEYKRGGLVSFTSDCLVKKVS